MPQLNSRPILWILLVLIALFTMNSALLAFRNVKRLRTGSAEPIEPWMSVSYIAHAYQVPNAVVADAIGINNRELNRQSIREIAQRQAVTTTVLIARITTAIEAFRMSSGSFTAPPP